MKNSLFLSLGLLIIMPLTYAEDLMQTHQRYQLEEVKRRGKEDANSYAGKMLKYEDERTRVEKATKDMAGIIEGQNKLKAEIEVDKGVLEKIKLDATKLIDKKKKVVKEMEVLEKEIEKYQKEADKHHKSSDQYTENSYLLKTFQRKVEDLKREKIDPINNSLRDYVKQFKKLKADIDERERAAEDRGLVIDQQFQNLQQLHLDLVMPKADSGVVEAEKLEIYAIASRKLLGDLQRKNLQIKFDNNKLEQEVGKLDSLADLMMFDYLELKEQMGENEQLFDAVAKAAEQRLENSLLGKYIQKKIEESKSGTCDALLECAAKNSQKLNSNLAPSSPVAKKCPDAEEEDSGCKEKIPAQSMPAWDLAED